MDCVGKKEPRSYVKKKMKKKSPSWVLFIYNNIPSFIFWMFFSFSGCFFFYLDLYVDLEISFSQKHTRMWLCMKFCLNST